MKAMGIKKWIALLWLITGMTIGIHQSRADLSFYDGFNYPSGNLNGQNGGTGFSSAWLSGKNTPTVYSSGLSYGSLTVSGGAISNNTVGNVMQVSSTLALPVNSSSNVVSGGGTIYISLLVSENSVNYDDLTFFNGSLSTEVLSIGNFYGTGNQPSTTYGFKSSNIVGGGIVNSSVAIDTSGNTHLLLMKLDYSTANSTMLSMYLDPTSATLGTAIASQTVNGVLSFNIVRLEVYGGNYMDEIRMGTSLADVMPGIVAVPEPASWLFVMMGAGWLFFIYRRRAAKV